MELLSNSPENALTSLRIYFTNYVLPLIIGLGLFTLYQYLVTGIWFEYFIYQSTRQGHSFSIPQLPFSSMEGKRTIWLSAMAMLLALVAFITLIVCIKKWLEKKNTYDKIFLLSTTYLSIILFLTIFFNPKWGTNTTNVMGMHRYTLATPFFFVFYNYLIKWEKYTPSIYAAMILLCNIAWFCFGSYTHIETFLFFNFNTILILLYVYYADKKIFWPILLVIMLNFLLQVNLFQQYISWLYPD